jgi:hypothetical protein
VEQEDRAIRQKHTKETSRALICSTTLSNSEHNFNLIGIERGGYLKTHFSKVVVIKNAERKKIQPGIPNKVKIILKKKGKPGIVAQACNPSCMRNKNQEDFNSRLGQARSLRDLHLNQ